jgi:hypothetical protein
VLLNFGDGAFAPVGRCHGIDRAIISLLRLDFRAVGVDRHATCSEQVLSLAIDHELHVRLGIAGCFR